MQKRNHDLKLELTELKVANQDLTQKVRELSLRNESLMSETELKRAAEMDVQIERLITEMSNYKADYLRALEESQRFSAELKAKESTLANLTNGTQGLETILKTTRSMLDLTKEQYSEQLETNTTMRGCLTELYNMVVAPEATQIDSKGNYKAMTPDTQMQIVQAINRVLNPATQSRATS